MSSHNPDTPLHTPPVRMSLLQCYLQLTKARLSALVVLSTAVGFVVARAGDIDWAILLWTVIGTSLSAASASAFNQVIEIKRDALMERTKHRPLPTGAMSPLHGYIAAVLMGYAGLAMLAGLVNLLAAGLALSSLLIYVLLYTPMKTRSTSNTLIGAVCGAIPPMIGWVAATGSLDLGAWVLGSILFVWQLPHFLALAWLYREDYRRGGFAMLPVIDTTGALTSRIVLITSIILIPLGLTVTLSGLAGGLFAIGSVVMGSWLVMLSARLHFSRTSANARKVFLASIMYLILLQGLLVIDQGPIGSPAQMVLAQDAPAAPLTVMLPDLGGR